MDASSQLSHSDEKTRQLLMLLETERDVSQRSLAERLGIALGLTNLLMRRIVRKGWVRVVHVRPNRVSYFLTPTGIAEKTRMTRQYLSTSLNFYVEARDRIRSRFDVLSATWDTGQAAPADDYHREKRIVFYGRGEVSEIGYVCLQGTDLTLVAVVDDKLQHFFGVPVFRRDEIGPAEVGGRPYDRVVVMSFENVTNLRKHLVRRGIPQDKVFWV